MDAPPVHRSFFRRAAPATPSVATGPALPAKPRPRRVRRLLWALFLLVDLPLVVVVAVGWAAAYLHPYTFWWAQLVAVGLPYAALTLGAMTLGPLLAWRRGLLAVHLVLLLLVLARAVPTTPLAAPPRPTDDDLVLLTFNVPTWGPSDRALADSVAALVRVESPHLVAMQETWVDVQRKPAQLPPQVRGVVGPLPYTVAVPPGRPVRRRPWPQGVEVPLLVQSTRAAPVALDQVELLLGDPEDDDASSALRTRFRWDGREWVHYNLHLRSFGEEKPWEDRSVALDAPATWLPYLRQYRAAYRRRAREITQLRAVLAADSLPVVVSGDFNESPDSWGYRQLAEGYTDAFRAAGTGRGRTYHARRPLVRIDFVLVSAEWDVVRAHVPDVRFSDHRPLAVRLRWKD